MLLKTIYHTKDNDETKQKLICLMNQ